jgi:putative oxidoreductase
MRIFDKLQPLSLLALRLGLGLIFFYHGYIKLNGHSGDVLGSYTSLGLPAYTFYIVGTLEVFGGLLLALGLATRVTALLLAAVTGIFLVRLDLAHSSIYTVPNYELDLALCAGAFVLLTTGAGLISLDAATFERGSKSRSKAKAS